MKARFKRSVAKIYRRFLKLRGDPHAIAMGLALGVFVGMSPLMGLHSVIAITVAAVFKWSKVAAILGVFVTNPLTAPVIYPLTYTLGAAVLGNPINLAASGGLNLGDLFHSSPQVLTNLFVGGGIVGLAGGAISYFVANRAIRRYRRRRRLRAEGEAPFAAVRRRLMRVARRQRRKARRKSKHKQVNARPGRRPRRRGHGSLRKHGRLAAGVYLIRPHQLNQRVWLPLGRPAALRGPSVHSGRMP
jgi:uncharacterized protein (DUF2062 family)